MRSFGNQLAFSFEWISLCLLPPTPSSTTICERQHRFRLAINFPDDIRRHLFIYFFFNPCAHPNFPFLSSLLAYLTYNFFFLFQKKQVFGVCSTFLFLLCLLLFFLRKKRRGLWIYPWPKFFFFFFFFRKPLLYFYAGLHLQRMDFLFLIFQFMYIFCFLGLMGKYFFMYLNTCLRLR